MHRSRGAGEVNLGPTNTCTIYCKIKIEKNSLGKNIFFLLVQAQES